MRNLIVVAADLRPMRFPWWTLWQLAWNVSRSDEERTEAIDAWADELEVWWSRYGCTQAEAARMPLLPTEGPTNNLDGVKRS